MKNPKNMTTDELIALADKIKRGMTERLLEDIAKIRKVKSHLAKQS